MDYLDESNPTPSNRPLPSHENVKNDRRNVKTDEGADWSRTSCWLCHDPIFFTPSWFSAPPGLTLPVGLRPDYWRNEPLYRTDVRDLLHTAAQHEDVVVSEFEK